MACNFRVAAWCWWLLLLLVVPQQQGLVGGTTVCRLRIEGLQHVEGVKSAALSCSGGTITAAAHPALLGRFTRGFSGVSWSNKGDCGAWKNKCLLTICGDSSATFVQASIKRMNFSTEQMLVCFAGHSKLVFHGATFMHNVGRPLTGLGTGVSLHLKSATFVSNTVTRGSMGGGALYMNGGTALVENSTFERGVAVGDGGAFLLTGRTNITFRSSTMRHNKAFRGGALFAEGDVHVSMHECSINSNNATWGGGLDFTHNTTGVLHSCIVEGNVVAKTGGGIYAGMAAKLKFTAALIMHNKAAVYGSGLAVWDSASVMLLNGTKLVNNTAMENGGAVCVHGNSTLVAHKASFYGNSANRGAGVYGAGHSLVALQQCTLSNNTGIGKASVGVALMLDDTAAGNITRCLFTGNTGDAAAGLLVKGSAYAEAHSVTFASNSALKHGGALGSVQQSRIRLTNCHLWHNSAKENGGCMKLEDDSRAIVVGHNTFIGNRANRGGCIYINGAARLEVVGAMFDANSALDAGGVLCATESAKATFRNSRFTGGISQPRVRGGAFNTDDKVSLTLTSCVISKFSASRGGAIAAYGGSMLNTDNVTFSALSAEEYGGAIYAVQQSKVNMTGGLVQQARAAWGGGLSPGNDAAVHLDHVTFSNCTARENGGCMQVDGRVNLTASRCNLQLCAASDWGGALAAQQRAYVSLHHCWLQGNTAAMSAGGIGIKGTSHLTLRDSILQDNSCHDFAGGILVDESASSVIRNSSIVGSMAERGGGLVLLGNGSLALQMASVHNNTARWFAGGILLHSSNFNFGQVEAAARYNRGPVAPDWFVMPTRMVVADNNTFQRVVSYVNDDKGRVNVSLKLTGPQGLPAEGVTITATLGAFKSHTYLMTKNTSKSGEAQMLIKLRQPPGTYLLQFSAITWDRLTPQNVTVEVLGCGMGEVRTSSGDGCDTCHSGYFSFNPGNTTCDTCVENAHCPGGALIVPNQDYWHSAPRSLQVHRCFNAAACPGSFTYNASGTEDYKTIQCAAGYRDNLCALCQPGYGTLKPFTCRQCMKPSATIALYTLAAIVMLVAVRVLCAFALADPGASTPSGPAKPVDLAKPLVVYAQWLYIVANIGGIPWPPSLSYPLQALGWLWSSASSTSLGLDCVLPRNAVVPVPAQKVLFGLLMPLAILAVLLCIETAVLLLRRRLHASYRRIHLRSRFTSMLICMTFLFLPTWSHTVFSLFACTPLDTPAFSPYDAHAVGSYWLQDMSEECYAVHGYHRYWALGLGIPLMLVCFSLPAGVAVFVWVSNKRGRLGDSTFRQRYGFMYRTWREEVCWWEAVVILQTLTLVVVETFGYALGPNYQSLVIVAALAAIGALLLAVKPHQSTAAGVVSLQSVGVLFTTAFSALTFLPHQSTTPPYAYRMTIGVFVLLVNVTFVLSTLWKLLRLIRCGALRRCGARCLCCSLGPCCKGEFSPRGMSMPVRGVLSAPCLRVNSLGAPLSCVSCGKQLQETAEGSVGQHTQVAAGKPSVLHPNTLPR